MIQMIQVISLKQIAYLNEKDNHPPKLTNEQGRLTWGSYSQMIIVALMQLKISAHA